MVFYLIFTCAFCFSFLINLIENYKIKNHFCCEFLGSSPGEGILFYNFQLDLSEKVKQDAHAFSLNETERILKSD